MKPLSSTFNPAGKLFIGLGNPGKKYEHTYHTIGVHALLFLANANRGEFDRPSRKHFSYVEPPARFGFGLGKPNLGPIFVLSETYMNESGTAARETITYFNKSPHDLVVLHDDSDMLVGTYKLSYNQRSAGHHGIDSIIAELGTSEFYRLKIGIRPTQEKVRKKAETFVLKKISTVDKKVFQEVFKKIQKEWGIRYAIL